MRILSSFFAVLFTFINPCMIYKVVSELESSFSHHMPEKLHIRVLESVCAYFINNNLTSRLRLAVYLSGLALYGHYSCRPVFIRPFLVDAVLSSFLLLLFVCFSMLMYLHMNSNGSPEEKELMRTQLRNVYVSAAFLLAYMAWLVISIAAYIDTKKLHADFMYWIVEEKISMRSKVNASSERSDRSSKGSKISNRSRTSNRSNRSNQSIKSERFYSERSAGRASPADVRLSVPL
ncbi:hypothetical protein GCK32_004065 [Trichostrongylus colubriformis]|uniref:Uncharacterized protein n=1 Tax=Trichostrongylus colubriformis TaxID=6319 RepID=A0AAN8FGS0_TRICO